MKKAQLGFFKASTGADTVDKIVKPLRWFGRR
jgi:hypothetical protein